MAVFFRQKVPDKQLPVGRLLGVDMSKGPNSLDELIASERRVAQPLKNIAQEMRFLVEFFLAGSVALKRGCIGSARLLSNARQLAPKTAEKLPTVVIEIVDFLASHLFGNLTEVLE